MKRPRAWLLAAALGAALGCNNTSSNSGDRVLVDKMQYETGIRQPQRFDVVVFKYPKGPIENNTPKNYIKRLLGLPGEILAIFFGRLFRFAPPPGEPPPFQEDRLDPTVKAKDLWQHPFMHVNAEKSRKLFDDGRLTIIRKTPSVMVALRRIVYDNDFQAKDMVNFPRWAPATKGSQWVGDKRFGFSRADAKAEQVDWLRYQHRVRPKEGPPPADLKPQLITDFMGYNAFETSDRHGHISPHTPEENWVGDLMLECQVEATKAEGEFWLELSKGINRFQARWDLGSGVCTLFKCTYKEIDEGGKRNFQQVERVELDSKPTKLRGPGTYQVRFANIDARLTVWVDRELPFGDGKDYPPPEVRNGAEEDLRQLDEIDLKQRRGPTRNDLEPASIGALGGAVQVHHLKLWRDTYYSLSPGRSDVNLLPNGMSDPEQWNDAYRKMDFKTLYVQPGHFLCLGDNSQASSDSREWGLVPERLMLGRALLVYFPFQRAGPIR
jgi:signal peptidase I